MPRGIFKRQTNPLIKSHSRVNRGLVLCGQDLSASLAANPTDQRTAVSWIMRLRQSVRGRRRAVVDDVGLRFQNQISREFAGGGACMTPCPVKPLAKKSPRTPGAGPMMGWWSGVMLIESCPCALGLTSTCSSKARGRPRETNIFSINTARIQV